MKLLFLICLLLFKPFTPSKQGSPIPGNAAYYKSKGFQVFPEYGLAIKPSCTLEDISNQMSGNNDLGVIQNYALPFSSVIGTGLCASLRASDAGPIS